MAAGRDAIMDQDGVKKISTILHDYLAPETGGSVFREVARFLQFGRATQTMGDYLVRFDLFQEFVASALRSQNFSLPRYENSLALASAQGTPGNFCRCPTDASFIWTALGVSLDRMFWRRRTWMRPPM